MTSSTMYSAGLSVDALFKEASSEETMESAEEISLPSEVILDYMYGVAAYNLWKSGQDGDESHEIMEEYYTAHYQTLPIPDPSPPWDDPNDDDSPEQDNPNDHDFDPEDDSSSNSDGLDDTGTGVPH